jgi:arabinogalactan endo-1,4-beta-galactosidase
MSRVSPSRSGPLRGSRALWSTVAAASLAVSGTGPALAATAAASPDRGTRTPIVVNPGFEADGTGVAAPLGWSTSGTATASYTELGGRSGSYRLTHWSPNAYQVDTYQTVKNIAPGDYTLGVWVRSGGGDVSNTISLTDCGSDSNSTAVPVDADGNWLQIVTSVHVTRHQCTINFTTDGSAGDWTNYDDVTFTAGYASLPIRGGDVSSLYRGEQDGGVYYTASGKKENALEILGDAGMNYVRLRVWVNPQDGFDDEQQLLATAKQAREHHMPILLDLHYSDTWADPGHQTIPAAWASDDYAQLQTDVYNYSKKVVSDMARQGTAPAMVQVGNEINCGMLWPIGYCNDFSQLAGLLKAGIAGVKSAAPHAEIVLHNAASSSLATLEWWYSTAIADGVKFDVIGLSYYDYWHGRLDVIQNDLDALAADYGKPLFLAETAYPWTMANGDSTSNSVNSSNTTLDPGYPATPAGQAANFRDVLSIVQAVPNGLGLGAFYWEPTWTVVPGNGWDPTDPSSGDGWENQAMFDFSDTALPVISDYAPR